MIIIHKTLKYIATVFFIILYLNVVAYLVPLLSLEYTMMEFVLMFVAVIFAFITSELIFKEKAHY